ncbi:MAG: SemiSWEET transporter [Candidatus Micrarchaeia archaeon]
MDFIEIVGLLAGLITTISSLPQLFKIVRTKKTRDISLGMFVLYFCGLVLWLAYGLLLGALPIILANLASMAIVAAILALKLKYG